ncbi:MAG: xanthine dehydrogenase family protein subunit M [Rhodobacteraceae bacterium]|nr:xanthine dehydrogenase family protein subunit M [Paracoccaceae bacterium]
MATYHRPTDLTEALDLLGTSPLTVAAGCTDLYPTTQAKSLQGDILDITAIASLRGITLDGAGWRIGAATTWADIGRADLPPGFAGLQQAAREVGSVQIQNVGTIVGNLCTASPAGDGAPCLLTLDASVELRSTAATRVLALHEFLTGARQTAARPDELVTATLIPASATAGTGQFEKLGARRYLVISIAMAALRLQTGAGRITGAAIAIGACSPTATRLPELETALTGLPLPDAPRTVTRDLIARRLDPIDDIRADRDYRIDAATELVRRGLANLTVAKEAAA